MTTPVLRDSEDWREVQRKLGALESGQTEIRGDIKRIEDQQRAQHKDNRRDIETMKVVLLGDPLNREDNPGVATQIDRVLSYGKATVFWAKLVAALITLLLAYIGLKEGMAKLGEAEPFFIFSHYTTSQPMKLSLAREMHLRSRR